MRRIRTHRLVLGGLALAIGAGFAVAGFLYASGVEEASRAEERAQALESDVASLARGARRDAEAILAAFDDAECQRVLADQLTGWTYRLEECEGLTPRVARLIPQTPGQASRFSALERQLHALLVSTRDLVAAARSGDVDAARRVASRFAQGP